MGSLANVFALLADQESENVSTIAGLDSTDFNPKNYQENKKKKNNKYGRGGKEEEGHHNHGQRGFGGNVVDREQGYNDHLHNYGGLIGYGNGSRNHYGQKDGPMYVNGGENLDGRGDEPVYKRSWQVKANAGDGQANGGAPHNELAEFKGVHMTSHHQDNYRARNRLPRITEIGSDQEFEYDEEVKAPDGGNQKQEADNSVVAEEVKASPDDHQEHNAVDNHSDENQGKVSAVTEVLSKEQLRERTRLAKEAAERKEKRLARQEETKRKMAMKTLKEYEEQKAIEKQKAEKASLSVQEAQVRGATLDRDLESMVVLSKEKRDNIHTKQKSKNETVKKVNNIAKDVKVHKTMSIEEFMKLPTGSEEQGQGGPGSDRSEDSIKNTNVGGRGRGRGGISRNYENSNHSGTGRGGGSRNYENFNHGGTGRGSSTSRESRNNEHDTRGGFGRGSSRYSRNRAPDLSETSLFPVLAEAIKSRKDLKETERA